MRSPRIKEAWKYIHDAERYRDRAAEDVALAVLHRAEDDEAERRDVRLRAMAGLAGYRKRLRVAEASEDSIRIAKACEALERAEARFQPNLDATKPTKETT